LLAEEPPLGLTALFLDDFFAEDVISMFELISLLYFFGGELVKCLYGDYFFLKQGSKQMLGHLHIKCIIFIFFLVNNNIIADC
jgi:hypothetical protein